MNQFSHSVGCAPHTAHHSTHAVFLVLCLAAGAIASGQTSTYVFAPDESTVTQTGGFAGVNWTYALQGRFQLAIDPNAGSVAFATVDANAVRTDDPSQSLDPNGVFNLTALSGEVLDETVAYLVGYAADGSSIWIVLLFEENGSIRLIGQTIPPIDSADFFVFTLDARAHRKYGGGTGEPNDPYQIATAADLIALGETPDDYDKHLMLTADIDLDPNLPGRKVFDAAVIAPDANSMDWQSEFQGPCFRGTFDGNGHVVSHLAIAGVGYLGLFGKLDSQAKVSNLGVEAVDVNGVDYYIAGLAGYNDGTIVNCYCGGHVQGSWVVGGIVGHNAGYTKESRNFATVEGDTGVGGVAGFQHGSVVASYNTGTITGINGVGGIAGRNSGCVTLSRNSGPIDAYYRGGGIAGSNWAGDITASYTTGSVRGTRRLGGLAGENSWDCVIVTSYSTGAVSGESEAGGFLGFNYGVVESSVWDVETSGCSTMCGSQPGGTGCDDSYGRTTAQMRDIATYLDLGWDFVGETANGTDDIWRIDEGRDYPRLAWEPRGQGGRFTYVFVPEHSTIVQTGGIAGIRRTYTLAGRFELSVDPDAGTAAFEAVDANAAEDSEYHLSLDPDQVFNLTGLAGTVVSETLIRFVGHAGDGSSVCLSLVFERDGAVRLIGETLPPVGSADFFVFTIDALAVVKPSGEETP